uniref:Uncharacterized protein n=1 Tax=Phage sp. ctL4h4 TaxID=2828005 RepID=A0A8S5TH36_9VIRU|nr:MAG TPA: hypothetical protein [Phage sp. ctL4h4]
MKSLSSFISESVLSGGKGVNDTHMFISALASIDPKIEEDSDFIHLEDGVLTLGRGQFWALPSYAKVLKQFNVKEIILDTENDKSNSLVGLTLPNQISDLDITIVGGRRFQIMGNNAPLTELNNIYITTDCVKTTPISITSLKKTDIKLNNCEFVHTNPQYDRLYNNNIEIFTKGEITFSKCKSNIAVEIHDDSKGKALYATMTKDAAESIIGGNVTDELNKLRDVLDIETPLLLTDYRITPHRGFEVGIINTKMKGYQKMYDNGDLNNPIKVDNKTSVIVLKNEKRVK